MAVEHRGLLLREERPTCTTRTTRWEGEENGKLYAPRRKKIEKIIHTPGGRLRVNLTPRLFLKPLSDQ